MPRKPATPTCPLHLHKASGQWRKVINRRHYYFGIDLTEALKRYERERPFLEQGLTPPPDGSQLFTIQDMVDLFMHRCQLRMERGGIVPRHLEDLQIVARRLLKVIPGSTPLPAMTSKHFERLQKHLAQIGASRRPKGAARSPVTLANDMIRVRQMFNFALREDMVEKVRYGEAFSLPTNREKRRYKAAAPKRLATPQELWTILDLARSQNPQLHAMILLGLNGGLGNSDCGQLSFHHLDWDKSLLHYPRLKTGIDRIVPLWPETLLALRQALEKRSAPADERWKDRVFLTAEGGPWIGGVRRVDLVSIRFKKLTVEAGLHRPGLSFYTLRHIFLTRADEARDAPARDIIMGHVTPGMSDNYRQEIVHDRLVAVAEHVRKWLLSGCEQSPESTEAGNPGHDVATPVTVRTAGGTTLRLTDQKHTHADVRFIDEDQPQVTPPCRLESGFSGAAQLLWKAGRTVTVTGPAAAEQTYVQEGDDGDFVGTVNPNIKIIHDDDDNWSITSSTDGTLASTNGKGQHGYPPEDWGGPKVEQAPQACTVRLGVAPSKRRMTAKQQASAVMQQLFNAQGIQPNEQLESMIERILLHFHDGAQAGIAFNDVQALLLRNEFFGENLPVPLTATEGYNQHFHTGPYDGGYVALQPHDHRDNFNGGLAFACYHPGTQLPQQNWAI